MTAPAITAAMLGWLRHVDTHRPLWAHTVPAERRTYQALVRRGLVTTTDDGRVMITRAGQDTLDATTALPVGYTTGGRAYYVQDVTRCDNPHTEVLPGAKVGRPAIGPLRSVRVPTDLWDAATAAAAANGTTVSDVIRAALADYTTTTKGSTR